MSLLNLAIKEMRVWDLYFKVTPMWDKSIPVAQLMYNFGPLRISKSDNVPYFNSIFVIGGCKLRVVFCKKGQIAE